MWNTKLSAVAKETLKGLRDLLTKLDGMSQSVKEEVADTIEMTAKEIERQAIRRAPIDTGKLRQSIQAVKIDELTYEVQANATGLAPYAPYVEFGTGGLVNVPPELQEMASKFRGRGIRKVNLRPRPYLYPALVANRSRLLEDLEEILERESGKI